MLRYYIRVLSQFGPCLEELKYSCTLFRSLCRLAPILENITTSLTYRKMATTISNKHWRILIILSKYVSSSLTYCTSQVMWGKGNPFLTLTSRGGHSYMYLVTHLRRKGIYHGAIYLKIGILCTLLVQINLIFFILDDPICIYKVASELVSSTLCYL